MVDAIRGSGVPVEKIYLSGGLSRISLIGQIKADVVGNGFHVQSASKRFTLQMLAATNFIPACTACLRQFMRKPSFVSRA